MLPKFKIVEISERFYVETDWRVSEDVGGVADVKLQVGRGGRLVTFHVGWAKREDAEKAINLCKARL